MFDRSGYFSKLIKGSQGSEEEKQCAGILYNDTDIQMGDKRLNSLAALTYNMASCQRIVTMLEKAINPTENPWKVIYKALLIIHTMVLYGSELAVDKCVDLCKYVYPLQDYNSALVKRGFFNAGGTDYGAPVRATAKTVVSILMKDENIRQARHDARAGQSTLVPMGEEFEQTKPSQGISMGYGQAISSSVGAGFGLENVPGMYEGRPDRYFDNTNDRRNAATVGNSQITRDKLAPSLLDLVFDAPAASVNPNLPQAEYLPALEKQKELERQLAEQQELLRKLQQQQLQQQQFPPMTGNPTPGYGAPTGHSNDLLGLSAPPNNNIPGGYQQPYSNNQYNPQQSFPPINQPSFQQPRPSYGADLLDFQSGPSNNSNQFQSINSGGGMGLQQQNQNHLNNSSASSGPVIGNETYFLENFHRQYQSHSIRFTESPVNTATPTTPSTNSTSNTSNGGNMNLYSSQPSSNGYDANTQLWSFDHTRAPPVPPPPVPSAQPGYYPNNSNPPYQNNQGPNNWSQQSNNPPYPYNNNYPMGGGNPNYPAQIPQNNYNYASSLEAPAPIPSMPPSHGMPQQGPPPNFRP